MPQVDGQALLRSDDMTDRPQDRPLPAAQRLQELTGLLTAQEDVQALYLMGSFSRDDGTRDPWSDIDLTVFTTDPGRYHDRDTWLPDPTSTDFVTWYTPRHARVLFTDGVLLEVGVFSEADLHPPHPLLGITNGQVIFDRANLAPRLDEVAAQHPGERWTAERYAQHLRYLLTHLLLVNRRLARGEVLSAYQLYMRFAPWVLKYLSGEETDVRPDLRDPLDDARRFEQRYPTLVHHLPVLMPACEAAGLRRAVRSALEILEGRGASLLRAGGQDVPEAVARAVRARIEREGLGDPLGG